MSDHTHVAPENDSKEHDLSLDCWCRPAIEGDIVIHNSLDRREDYEGTVQ